MAVRSTTPTSRYALTKDTSGRTVTERKGRKASRFLTITSIDGQTFQELASRYLADPKLYWRIADLNPHVLYPDEIPMGTKIRIPEV